MEPTNGPAQVPNQAADERDENEGDDVLDAQSRWGPFWSYRKHAALEFEREEDLDAAIDLLWNDPELWGLPRVHVGQNTMIVPAPAVPLFQKKARNFKVNQARSIGELTPEEARRVRRGEEI